MSSSPDNTHHELSREEKEKLSALFNRLDVNKDGSIDIHDLSAALSQMEVPQVPGQAQRFFEKTDVSKDGQVNFAEFVQYVAEHEKKLRLFFRNIDTNQDGAIDVSEIITSFKNLGLHVDQAEAEKLLQRMDKDGTLKIDWDEWREYLLLHPSQNIHDIIAYWRHSTVIDIGENVIVPDDFTEKELQSGMWWRYLVAGGTAGAVSRTCTAPLDRLKVLQQVHGKSGIRSGFKHMLEEGGVKSLWRGNGINVFKIAPESALKFSFYENIKSLFKKDKHELGMAERFISGSLAGAISQTIIYPMEVLKTRLAVRKTGQYKGIFDCAKQLLANEGLSCFYKGYIPNLIGILPYAGIDLCVYETLKSMYLARSKSKQDPSIFVILACGTISSTCGQLTSYPLALVRTRLQAHGASHTMTSMFKDILRKDGFRGLYRGLTPNFMKVAPAVSISYVVYEHTRTALGVSST
ncbi:calcium-binding mitochondrial carrier protein SCaMC-2 [Octopus bimaculoides]|uniref:EF-hand domain-containing protein n=1 Tax=Octopus bimaculoides TaxID=37653 RepID=A0A0L8FN13_OCTBM|nr:calcium-binding mitochondrial carrier protein SCaMC-2 [Octopus bimaculoides]|eukprot:XP_014788605.1 PREDICTED: calcium-binding mitochondrial carrier protein SCaMC-2-like [Octopus bimaculoides]